MIRNVDDAVLKALKERAASTGSSLEEEARRALAASVGLTRAEALARLHAVRVRIGAAPGPSIVDEALRRGLRDMSAKPKKQEPFQTSVHDGGALLMDVKEALAMLDEEYDRKKLGY